MSRKHKAYTPEKHQRVQKALAAVPEWQVILLGFQLEKSWDDDDEECLDVVISANGVALYSKHNENHDVGWPDYGAGSQVTVHGDRVEMSGFVLCTDYHEPFYGQSSQTHTDSADSQIGASQNGGRWSARYRIVKKP